MKTLITRKKLLVLNMTLSVVFILSGFFGILWPLLSAKEPEDLKKTEDSQDHLTKTVITRPQRLEYNIIEGNDLFVYKGSIQEPIPTKNWNYALPWKLIGIADYPDGLHALIHDEAETDPITRLPRIYEVRVGDKVESDKKQKIYSAEILEITKDRIKYYRHDMQDVFILPLWQEQEQE